MNLKSLIKETIPVVLGVLIALIIGDLKTKYDDNVYLKTMLEAMKEESITTIEDLEFVIVRHQALIDTIVSYEDDGQQDLADLVQRTNGFQSPSLSRTASKTLLGSRTELVEYEMLSLNNNINEIGDIVKEKIDRVSSFLLNNVFSTEQSDKLKLMLLVQDLISSEHRLKELHQEFINDMTEENGD